LDAVSQTKKVATRAERREVNRQEGGERLDEAGKNPNKRGDTRTKNRAQF